VCVPPADVGWSAASPSSTPCPTSTLGCARETGEGDPPSPHFVEPVDSGLGESADVEPALDAVARPEQVDLVLADVVVEGAEHVAGTQRKRSNGGVWAEPSEPG